MVSRIVCFILMVGLANAATFIGKLPVKPKEHAHKTGCYIAEINDVIPYGDVVSPVGVCYRIECSRHMLYYSSCGTISEEGPSNCYTSKEDLSVPYPSCCPEIKCEQDNYLI